LTVSILLVGIVEIGAGIVCHKSARAPRMLRGKKLATLILGTWLAVSGLLVVLGQLLDGQFDLFMKLNALSAIGALPAILWAQQLDQDSSKKVVLIREIAGLLDWRVAHMPVAEAPTPVSPPDTGLPAVAAIGWIYDEMAAKTETAEGEA
jgi:hypothetical protein